MSAVLKLVQGSPEWHAHRSQSRNASETPVVLGISPYMTPFQLWEVRTGRKTVEVTLPMRHGKELEPAARRAYEALTGLVMEPLVLAEGDYSASLDGITLDGALILEVKCPLRGQASELWKQIAGGALPDHYYWQVQHQLMVSDALLAHVFVDRDTLERTDAEWQAAATKYIAAKRAAEAATTQLDAAKQRLVGLTSHASEAGCGVSVTRYWKAGAIDYKKVPELKEVDLEDYRGPGRFEVRVSVSGK